MADAHTIARPYAEAVFELAKDRGELEQWEQTLSLMARIASDEGMERLLSDPRVPQERQAKVFREVAGDQLGKEADRFLETLFANDRLTYLPDIYEIFRELRREAEGEVHAVVTSAVPLSEAQQATVISRLKERFGQEVTLETKVDESLLGGMVIRAGDLVIDGSVRGGLEQLRNHLQA